MIVYEYTPMIRISDGRYPVYLYDFLQDNPNVTIGTFVYSENLVSFGYFPVMPTTRPVGDVVTEGPPYFNDQTQEWEQTWTVRDFTPEEIAANLAYAKEVRKGDAQNLVTNDINAGIPYPLDQVEYKVRVKGFDIATLLSIKNVLEQDGSQSTEVYPFQFLDGYKSDFTYTEMMALVNDVTRAQYTLMKTYWAYLDAVDKSTTIQNIPDLPTSFI